MPEMLLGYFIGPFGALLSSGIFTSILQNYFTDVLKLDLGFLTTLQLISTVLIVAANLVVGQLIERTRALAGKARPWILLSALTDVYKRQVTPTAMQPGIIMSTASACNERPYRVEE